MTSTPSLALSCGVSSPYRRDCSIRVCRERLRAGSCIRRSRARCQSSSAVSHAGAPMSGSARPSPRPAGAKPPRHLADLTAAERREAVAALGEKPFRAKQLSQHYFARLRARPRASGPTSRPPRARSSPAALLPELMTVVRHISCDDGHHPQDAVAALRRHAGRVRADALPGPGHHVHQLAGRLRDELPVLRHRPGRAGPQPVHRRDRRTRSWTACGRCATARSPAGPARLSQHRLHGHGRAAGQLQARSSAPSAGSPTPSPTASASRSAASPSPPSAWCRRCCGSPTRASSAGSRSRCTRPTTSCATPSCRSTPAGRCARCWTRRWEYAEKSGRRVSIEYALIRDINDQAWRGDLLGPAAQGQAGARQPDPAEPDPGLEVDRLAARGRAGVRRGAWRPTACR